ncbi:DUF1385 domain-containing protein [Candidatus Gracilibacteria bacterium]|nr:DUF1385 domain-containing protein [Candidatus Gracilibacteria bacterium]
MDKKIDFAIGGQAVIEGVMMRSPHFYTVAVRKQNGEIITMAERFDGFLNVGKIKKIPLVRGVVNLVDMMRIGVKALNFSADHFAADMEEPDDKSKKTDPQQKGWLEAITMALSFVLSIALAIFMFKFIPLYSTEFLRARVPVIADNYLLFNIIEGTLRILVFFAYIGVLSFTKTFKRIFQYHGAEHMSIHAYEHKDPLNPHHIEKYSPRHPRCGTSFIMAVLIVSIVVYTFIPRNPIFWINMLQRLSLLPVIAGIGYEILKWSAKHITHPLVKLVTIPGLATQYITTKQPDHKQIEVAVAALELAIEKEKSLQS